MMLEENAWRFLMQARSRIFHIPMKSSLKKLFVVGALLGAATVANAQLYIATGSSGVTTWFNFTIDPTLNRVTVLVDNTHPGVGGVTGTVTSFGFNIPATLDGTGSLLSTTGVPAGTWSFFEPYNLNNFDQDAGAGSGANVNGGQPNEGVKPGFTATFVFQFAEFSDATGFLGPNGVSLKWQGLSTTGQSDHGFGNPGNEGPTPAITPVPEPSTYGMMGAAFLAVALFVRRLRAKALAL
jgi:hypothetical protein